MKLIQMHPDTKQEYAKEVRNFIFRHLLVKIEQNRYKFRFDRGMHFSFVNLDMKGLAPTAGRCRV